MPRIVLGLKLLVHVPFEREAASDFTGLGIFLTNLF